MLSLLFPLTPNIPAQSSDRQTVRHHNIDSEGVQFLTGCCSTNMEVGDSHKIIPPSK